MTLLQRFCKRFFGWNYVICKNTRGAFTFVRVRKSPSGVEYIKNFNGSFTELLPDGMLDEVPYCIGDYILWKR